MTIPPHYHEHLQIFHILHSLMHAQKYQYRSICINTNIVSKKKKNRSICSPSRYLVFFFLVCLIFDLEK